ncbi:MAG: ornithine carbamoyltransferase [Candidatus Edwardsbacteria bacterium]|nr:ornithine carbamoyltransferase [Candidatus Edwardsbacteria bacterium]
MNKDLLSVADLNKKEMDDLFRLAIRIKKPTKAGRSPKLLAGRTLAMIFEKPSLRTRVTFETGITQLGGHGIFMEMLLGKRESTPDIARNLCRWVDLIMARTFSHKSVAEMAGHATVPVINALSDLEHPCQILADFMTILEHKKKFTGLKLVYVGDGNNVSNSLLLAAATQGMHMTVAGPQGYDPDKGIWAKAQALASKTKAQLSIVRDPREAVKNADVIYTDVWASMGQESEKEMRARIFAPYQVNQQLMGLARKDAIFLHCLPAHRGDEVTDEVLDGPQSQVLDQAENRLHIQKAIMVTLHKYWQKNKGKFLKKKK